MAQRNTQQRQAIQRAVEAADRPLDAQEVLSLARRWLPGLGLATVYRTLKAGAEAGWLTPVELPGGATRYEPAGKGHHHHFECRSCHRVFDIAGCPGEPGQLQQLTPAGFTLEAHEVVLYGLCDQCAS
jgi:Fur family ferric uptake transcriptional regulator